jgi:hypothetical protein
LKDAPSLPKAVKKEKWVKGNMVKGRNEPVSIPHVAYAIAQIKGITVEEVCEAWVFLDSRISWPFINMFIEHGTTQSRCSDWATNTLS